MLILPMTDASPLPAAPPIALCLGGLDPSAGAGLLRDVMTVAALGVHPMAVPTCLTLQNGARCEGIEPPADPAPFVASLRPHLGGRWGVKLGLCALAPDVFKALVALLNELGPAVRIWDPVLAPTAGVGHHEPAGLRLMAEALLPGGGWVVSPNLLEAAALSGLEGPQEPAALAAPLLELGAAAVWLKGGHGQGDLIEDVWITRQGLLSLGRSPRLTPDLRGTGCALASAWLAMRLKGQDGPAAAMAAARHLRGQWHQAVVPGDFGRACFAPAGA